MDTKHYVPICLDPLEEEEPYRILPLSQEQMEALNQAFVRAMNDDELPARYRMAAGSLLLLSQLHLRLRVFLGLVKDGLIEGVDEFGSKGYFTPVETPARSLERVYIFIRCATSAGTTIKYLQELREEIDGSEESPNFVFLGSDVGCPCVAAQLKDLYCRLCRRYLTDTPDFRRFLVTARYCEMP